MPVNGAALAVASFGGLLLYSAVKGVGVADAARSLLSGQPVPQTTPFGAGINAGLAAVGGSGPQGDQLVKEVNQSNTAMAAGGGAFAGGSTAVKALSWAEQQIGKPYKWGGTGPDSFDCSGLIFASYRAIGVKIPRLTTSSFLVSKKFSSVPRKWDKIQVGDLVFPYPGHVVLVVDPNTRKILEAPHTGANVRYANYSEYRSIFAVRRYNGS